MAVLTLQQRNKLESAVKQARKVAELGAFNALHGLAVDNKEPFAHLTSKQRTLRNSLWAKAKLLGDILDKQGMRNIYHLTYELAYETWHKMLFAKFLESNNMLIHPDGVAITMEDCEEFARDEGFIDKWDAAATYASKMLPAIFRVDDPLMQVIYATDDRIKLEEIIDGVENQIFVADDAIGWVYQFWQSEAKAAINASGDKIDGEKLPAVTQLFTEPYMVHFLIDNTIGAWWVSRNPGIKPPIKFEYLRLLDDGSPAAGKFEGWPDKTAEITSLDPCMGSGHFVVSLFNVFALLRIFEEGITKEEATDKVIAENLHGLELDARCTQIAAFNLALTAWKFCGHYMELPEMNLACSGIAPQGKKEEWVKLVGKASDSVLKARMENGMKVLYDHFQLAPELGSLLDPSIINPDAFTASFEELQPVLKKALENEFDKEQLERGIMAAGIAKAGQLLSKKYTLQITNVPYLGRGRQVENGTLSTYCDKYYSEAKNDLATTFLDRILDASVDNGVVSCVIPVNWLYLTTYKKFREKLLKNFLWNYIAKLGAGAFSQIGGEVVQVILIILTKKSAIELNKIAITDVSNSNSISGKDEGLLNNKLNHIIQIRQLNNPDYSIILSNDNEGDFLNKYAHAYQGISPADLNRFELFFWEVLNIDGQNLIFWQSEPSKDCIYTGLNSILKISELKELLAEGYGAMRGENAWGKKGIAIRKAGVNYSSIYSGNKFNTNVAILIPENEDHLIPLYCFINSNEFKTKVREIDSKIGITEANITKVRVDLTLWEQKAKDLFPNGLPQPYSDDPTQWLFHGNPIKTTNPLQVALARMLGYHWPAESGNGIELAAESKVLIEKIKVLDRLTDDDGIFCIPSVNAEQAGADRLRSYLQEVFGTEWNNQTIMQLLAKEGAASSNLEDWLLKEFFIQHCKVFQNRPFIWHIWDGRIDGFSALVNYHKLDKSNLSKLIYAYLGDWIRMCEAKKKAGESGAEGLLSAALKLKEKLEAILKGEILIQGKVRYDIFVRWKPIEGQPMGWEPDLNDGIRLNIRPFMEADILRKKPNIKWGIDRGKNPENSFWGTERDNDKHLTLEKKRTARERANKNGK